MSYLPQWKARALATAALGADAFVWTRRGRHYAGWKFANGRRVTLGEGGSWQEAIDNASRHRPARHPDKLT